MSSKLREYSAYIIGWFLIVEGISVYFLWALNPTTKIGESIFGIVIGIILVSFAIISYVYRAYDRGDAPSKLLLLAGCVMILVLIYTSLAI